MRLLVAALLMFVVGLTVYRDFAELAPAPDLIDVSGSSAVLSEERAAHILHGDGRGGGHLYGTGVPCKSEFPQDWDEARILSVTQRMAANDNLDWEQQGNGYFVAEEIQDGVKVRVVIDGQKRNIITSYPTNVPRNPCPANDN